MIKVIWKFADDFVDKKEYFRFLSLDEKGFALLGKYRKNFYRSWFSREDKLKMICFMIEGKPFKEAEKLLAEEKERRARFWRKFSQFYDQSLGRAVKAFCVVGEWFGMMIESARKGWKEINEMCPLESPDERLK